MKSKKLQDALGMIDHDLIADAEKAPKKKTKHVIKWTAPIAAMLAIALAFGIFFGQNSPFVPTAYALAEAEYPNVPKFADYSDKDAYDAWRDAQKRQAEYFGKAKGLEPFISATVSEFLGNAGDKNLVYSPLNVYLALAILAETTDGETREQILSLLGAEDIESLRENANTLWNANYNDDGIVTSLLASSLWLRNGVGYHTDTLNTIAKHYYASSFSGEMGSEEYNKQLQGWLDKQTGGLLSEQIQNVEFDPETIFAIATTIYFKASWATEFSKEETTDDIFHEKERDVMTEFMHRSANSYIWQGEHFSAAELPLTDSGSMWFLLPDEDIDLNTLLKDTEALSFISQSNKYQWEDKVHATVNYSIPKFDVNSDLDLIEGLKALGVTDCFFENADFTPITTEVEDLYVSKVNHSARVKIDEEGLIAAAFTLIEITTESASEQEPPYVDFTVDRPFIFVITGEDGSILFVGAVNHVSK